jgi:hypothetical protein
LPLSSSKFKTTSFLLKKKKEGKGGKNRRPIGLVVLCGGPEHVMEQEGMVKM